MQKNCEVCGKSFTARRSDAKYCGSTCRSRRSQEPGGRIVALPGAKRAEALTVTLTEATRVQLERAGRADSPIGIAALLAAQRLDAVGMVDTGAGVAALLKAHREALAEAMKDAKTEADPLEVIRQSAALKLLRDAG